MSNTLLPADSLTVQDLLLLAEKGRLHSKGPITVQDCGALAPLVELEFCRAHHRSEFALVEVGAGRAVTIIAEALEKGRRSGHHWNDRMGVLPICSLVGDEGGPVVTAQWVQRFKNEAVRVDCPGEFAAMLAGVLGELIDNVLEHAENPARAVAGFRVEAGAIEFVVFDSGVGALASLQRNPKHANLPDAAAALRAIVFEHATRYPDRSNHGQGMRQLFKTLTGRMGSIRIRSDGCALELSDDGPIEAGRLETRAEGLLPGFGISVLCRLPSPP